MKIEIILLITLASVFLVDYLMRKRKISSTKEIEKVESSETNRKSKIPILILFTTIFLVLSVFFVDNQFYRKTLFKNDGFSFFDKLVSKRYHINNVKQNKLLFIESKQEFETNNFFGKRVVVDLEYIKADSIVVYKSKNNQRIDGVLYDDFGNLGFIKNGLRKGKFTTRYSNGQVESKSNYLDGYYDGEYLSYYVNGQIKYKKSFDDYMINGKSETYAENGQIIAQRFYLKGKREGTYYYYYESGSNKALRNFKNNLREGESLDYFRNGKLQFKFNFKNGKQDGVMVTYRRDGSVESKVDVSNGQRDGKTLEFYKNGNRAFYTIYKNDEIIREFYYNEDGSMNSEWIYKNGSASLVREY